MNFLSSGLIKMLEQELAKEEPAVQAYLLKIVNMFAADLMSYVEKKIGISAPVAPAPEQNPPS